MKDETVFWLLIMFVALILDVIVFNRAAEANDGWIMLGSGLAFSFTFLCIGLVIIAGD